LKFTELNLHPALASAVEALKYDECTPVQAATMPHILEGKDISGLAQTGTGKTAAFLLPLMERILRARNPEENNPRAFVDWRSNQFILVLVPTRELCEQVYENAKSLSGTSGLRAVSIYGGVSYEKQKQGLRDGVEFVIATPGRLIDLFKEHLVDLKNVRAICFDEADRMFDMGFKDDMKYILQRVPKERQFLVFSATLNLDVLNTAYQFGANPVEVNVSRDQAKAENVQDEIFHIGNQEKPMYLLSLLKKHKPRQTIVFSNYKMNVARLAQFLSDNGVPAVGISSLLTQAQRNRVMEQFKGENDHNVMIATDVAARGLDIKGVDMVVNYELPDDAENYVHRIGRTGRAGEKGKAFSFVSDRDVEALSRIEDYLKHKVETAWIEDSELVKDFRPLPSDHGSRKPRQFDRAGDGRNDGRGGGRGEPRQGPGGDRPRRERAPRPPGPPIAPPGPRVEGAAAPSAPREGGGRDRRPRGPGGPGAPGAPGAGPGPRAPREGGPRANGNGNAPRHAQNGGRGSRPSGGPSGPNGGPGNGPGRGGPGPRGSRPAGGPGSGPGRGPGPRQQTKPPAGIGAKVSGFFKRLFS
jgi:superfamily II DNA/RNA helicase